MKYNVWLEDSKIYYQDIKISNLTFKLSVLSSRSPEVIYNKVTNKKGRLDEEPAREWTVAIILLTGAVMMLLISLYKTYRFCIKYTLKDWLR